MKELKEQISLPRKLALYSCLTMDFVYVAEVSYVTHDKHYEPLPEGEHRERPNEGYVRVSAPIDIVFAPIDDDSMIQNAVDSLDAEEQKARQELQAKLHKIAVCRSNLLALAHQPESQS